MRLATLERRVAVLRMRMIEEEIRSPVKSQTPVEPRVTELERRV
jgi:hypothetical protein